MGLCGQGHRRDFACQQAVQDLQGTADAWVVEGTPWALQQGLGHGWQGPLDVSQAVLQGLGFEHQGLGVDTQDVVRTVHDGVASQRLDKQPVADLGAPSRLTCSGWSPAMIN